MKRVLVLAGGSPHAHDFASLATEWGTIAEEVGFAPELYDHPDDAARRLERGGFDVLAVSALYWRMQADRYEPWRAQWAYRASAELREAVDAFVRAGGGIVAAHTAVICFDDWRGWGDVVGARWDWERSFHPPVGAVTVDLDPRRHPLVAGLPERFTVVDELYTDLDLDRAGGGVDVLATGSHPDVAAPQPVLWVREVGSARVVFCGLGHDVASLRQPQHRTILQRSLRWVTEA